MYYELISSLEEEENLALEFREYKEKLLKLENVLTTWNKKRLDSVVENIFEKTTRHSKENIIPFVKFINKEIIEGACEDRRIQNFFSSIILNAEQNYGAMISDLPNGFFSRETECNVHIESQNELEVMCKENNVDKRIITASVYFLDNSGEKTMYVNNIQGNPAKPKKISKENMRLYGKLNNYFEENWRVGIAKQLKEYANKENLKFKGVVSGLFSHWGAGVKTYPVYSIDYVRTYLSAGLLIDEIEFEDAKFTSGDYISEKKQINCLEPWNIIKDYLRSKDMAESSDFLFSIRKQYLDQRKEIYKTLEDENFKEKFWKIYDGVDEFFYMTFEKAVNDNIK